MNIRNIICCLLLAAFSASSNAEEYSLIEATYSENSITERAKGQEFELVTLTFQTITEYISEKNRKLLEEPIVTHPNKENLIGKITLKFGNLESTVIPGVGGFGDNLGGKHQGVAVVKLIPNHHYEVIVDGNTVGQYRVNHQSTLAESFTPHLDAKQEPSSTLPFLFKEKKSIILTNKTGNYSSNLLTMNNELNCSVELLLANETLSINYKLSSFSSDMSETDYVTIDLPESQGVVQLTSDMNFNTDDNLLSESFEFDKEISPNESLRVNLVYLNEIGVEADPTNNNLLIPDSTFNDIVFYVNVFHTIGNKIKHSRDCNFSSKISDL